MSVAETAAIEAEAQMQATSELWFQHRTGRNKASRFKPVAASDPPQPSPSLMKGTCYNSLTSFLPRQPHGDLTMEKLLGKHSKNLQ